MRLTSVALAATAIAISISWPARAEAPGSFAERWWPATETLRTALALAAKGQQMAALTEPEAITRVQPAMLTRSEPAGARTSIPRTRADGLASFYGSGSRTASGERFNARALTAAHRTLPFGTRVRVTNVSSGQSVTVRINDRGPFIKGRVIDVSPAAAEELGMVGHGLAKVKLDVVE